MDDRVEVMRILSAGNTIMMLVLGAILGLQVSPDYRSRGRPSWFLDGAIPSVPFFPRRAHVFSRRLVADAVSRTFSLFRRLLDFLSVSLLAPPMRVYCLRSADVYSWEQGGQEYARRVELKELAKLEKVEKEEAARSTSDKDKKE